jgi:uncharacterized protein YegP (UPF0339 family)
MDEFAAPEREFSRRVDVQIIKRDVKTREKFAAPGPNADEKYREYVGKFQPYRWKAVAANNEPLAHGESYFNLADCINAVTLLLADDTTVYYTHEFGEDRGLKLLRYGSTDRAHQGGAE